MDAVLFKAKVKAGKEAVAREWIDFLTANKEKGEETLKNEREHLEVYFMSEEDGISYIYMFVLADDLQYANQVAAQSGNPLDKKHFEYMAECIDVESAVQIAPELILGDLSVFGES
ncbi:DUF6176 family protein [uncultured Oscillibacter sp.]|uniref:DUF6176 family protein n=1 Tax=uncultured Oscillibacter sp. TaxID=876091 RepID=UPI0025CE8E26|nr:DUF6176 family protein [uncultured Oscillibacter sp.]